MTVPRLVAAALRKKEMAVLRCRNPASNLRSLIDSCSLTHSLIQPPIHQTNRTHSLSLLLVLHLLILFPFIPSLLHQLPQPRFFLSLFPVHMQLVKESWVGCQTSYEFLLYDTFISLPLSFLLSSLSPTCVVLFFHTFCFPFSLSFQLLFFTFPSLFSPVSCINLPSFSSSLFYCLSFISSTSSNFSSLAFCQFSAPSPYNGNAF